MLYRTVDEIIQAALLTTKDKARRISENNKKKNKYNEKIRKRVKKG